MPLNYDHEMRPISPDCQQSLVTVTNLSCQATATLLVRNCLHSMGHFDPGWVVVVSNISTEQIQGRHRFIYWLMRGCAGNRVKIHTPNQSHNAIQH